MITFIVKIEEKPGAGVSFSCETEQGVCSDAEKIVALKFMDAVREFNTRRGVTVSHDWSGLNRTNPGN